MECMARISTGVAFAVGIVACEPSSITTAPSTGQLLANGAAAVVAFEAELTRSTLESIQCTQGVCDLRLTSSGATNIMGLVTVTNHVVQDFTTTPCSVALAELTLVGATGSITLADVAGTVCPNPSPDPTDGFISGHWEVTDGTGEFDGISGSGTTTGPIGGNGPAVHLSGSVSY